MEDVFDDEDIDYNENNLLEDSFFFLDEGDAPEEDSNCLDDVPLQVSTVRHGHRQCKLYLANLIKVHESCSNHAARFISAYG